MQLRRRIWIGLKHLAIWLLVIFVLTNSSLSWGWTISTKHDTLWIQVYGALTNACVFYGTSFFLIPKFYNTRKRRLLISYSALLLIMVTGIELFLDSIIGNSYQSKGYLAAQELDWVNYILDGLVYTLPINIFYFFTAFAYRLPLDRQKLFEKQALLQKQNLEAKLDFLKAQVHPHTLFNAMNSIYHLIDQRPDAAKEMVLNLSQAMRYHLYESKDDFAPLSKELDYLKNYIAIYKIRKEEDAKIEINIEEYSDHAKVAPLILTPFIENAFKFVSQDANPEKNWIDISIKVENGYLYFECTNTKEEASKVISNLKGLGIPNVKSRLDLLYGDLYELDLDDSGTLFTVNLRLPLKGING